MSPRIRTPVGMARVRNEGDTRNPKRGPFGGKRARRHMKRFRQWQRNEQLAAALIRGGAFPRIIDMMRADERARMWHRFCAADKPEVFRG